MRMEERPLPVAPPFELLVTRSISSSPSFGSVDCLQAERISGHPSCCSEPFDLGLVDAEPCLDSCPERVPCHSSLSSYHFEPSLRSQSGLRSFRFAPLLEPLVDRCSLVGRSLGGSGCAPRVQPLLDGILTRRLGDHLIAAAGCEYHRTHQSADERSCVSLSGSHVHSFRRTVPGVSRLRTTITAGTKSQLHVRSMKSHNRRKTETPAARAPRLRVRYLRPQGGKPLGRGVTADPRRGSRDENIQRTDGASDSGVVHGVCDGARRGLRRSRIPDR